MKTLYLLLLALGLALAASACGDDDGNGATADADIPDPPDSGLPEFTDCIGSDESFVRQASLALIGRRPVSEGELDVYVQILKGVAAKEGDTPAARQHGRQVVAQALMNDPLFIERWQRHFLDELHVQRLDDQEMRGCYGSTARMPDDGSLARAVLAAAPRTAVPGGAFTMRDLLRSAIVADDITPVYRGNLFALVSRPIPAANVPEVEAELARRADFGNTFDTVYLNRDIVCLGCHNSEFSTTFRDDPATNRHWPLNGLLEKSVYGESTGVEIPRAHAMFRYSSFAEQQNGNGIAPWGMSADCGTFYPDGMPNDPADIDAHFVGISGGTATVFDTEASLARGFASLRANGLVVGADGTVADKDAAFAYLVAMNIVDGVWQEVTGNSLVIANYFPRNAASRDELQQLTDKYIASGFSLRALLGEIVLSPYFNRLPPASGCGTGPYNMPAIYDPWVSSDADAERRLNGSGDAVNALSTRTAARAAYGALQWKDSPLYDFPDVSDCDTGSCSDLGFYCQSFGACCAEKVLYCDQGAPRPDANLAAEERSFQRATGQFLKNAERGFRGLDFQARLEWENRFGLCQAPAGLAAPTDFVDDVIARAATDNATVRDVVLALKDRLVSDASIDETTEKPALEALFGVGLDMPITAVTGLEDKTRRVCGAIMSSPQFLLAGLAAQTASPVPKLTPDAYRFGAVCPVVAGRGLPGGLTVTCAGDTLTIQ